MVWHEWLLKSDMCRDMTLHLQQGCNRAVGNKGSIGRHQTNEILNSQSLKVSFSPHQQPGITEMMSSIITWKEVSCINSV